MHQSHRDALQKTQRHKALFEVVKPVVLKRERRTREHLRSIYKVQAVGLQISSALFCVPLVAHLQSVYTKMILRKT
jgi:hypothetical protein